MKKADAIRWEKLEGEGQESNIKHFNPSQSTASAFLDCLSALISQSDSRVSFLSVSAKINISSSIGLRATKMRVGSGALLDSFISLTVKVGRKGERYDSKL